MRFPEAVAWLESFQFHGIKPGLERISRLLRSLGNPETHYPCIHLAGTNGKGSTAVLLSSLLQAHGLRVGLYTSPHLQSVCERFRINGKEISPEKLADVLSLIRKRLEELSLPATYFEITTAAAFWYFAEEKIDVAVIECGLGGRLDATNVCHPILSIITNVARDHTAFLGRTLRAIAQEKAGIIKPGVPVVAGRLKPAAREEIEKKCRETQSPLYLLGRDFRIRRWQEHWYYRGRRLHLPALSLSLSGDFQGHNLALALASLEILAERGYSLKEALIRQALSEVSWPGRLEFLRIGPGIILDGAHNEDGIRALIAALLKRGWREYVLLFGTTNEGGEKPYVRMLRQLLPWARKVYLCEPPGPRNPVRSEDWARELPKLSGASSIYLLSDWRKALKKALREGGPVVVTGSLYLVGAVRAELLKR